MDPVKNFGFVTVSTGYDASAISIVLSSGHGLLLPDPVVDGAYNLPWYDSTNYNNPAEDPNVEIVRVTGPSGIGDTKTIVRAQEGTSATTKNTADSTYKMFSGATAKTITDIQDLTFPADQIEVSTIGTPTYDDMQDFMNLKSSGIITGGIISDSGSGQIDVSAGAGIIKISDTVMSETKSFDWSLTENIVLTDALVSYVYIDYNVGSPIVAVTTDRTTIEQYRQFTLGRVCRNGTEVKIINSGTQITDHDRETHERLIHRGIQHAEGAVVSETGTRNIASTAGVLYLGNNQLLTISQDTSGTDLMIRWYHSGGTWTSSTNAQIDNTYYDDGTDLAELTVNRYGVHWIFICGCGGDLKSVYGQGNYTLTQAENASVPSSLPDCIDKLAILAAKIIIQKSASSFISIVSAYDTQFPVSSPSNHNDLGGIQGGSSDDYYHITSAQHDLVTNKTVRYSSLSVAASDSSTLIKAQSDYVCDGTDDHVEINAAIAALAHGGILHLQPGNFYIGSPILIGDTILLQGSGIGTASVPVAVTGTSIQLHSGSNCDMIQVDGDGTIIQFPQFRDFRLNGRKSLQTSGNGISFIADLSDCIVENVFVYDCKESGIKSVAGWYMHYNNVWSEYNDTHGFEINEGWLTGCISTENVGSGILCNPGAAHVMNTRIKNNGLHGIDIKGWTSRDITIVGNEIQYNSYGNSGLYDGISLTGGHETQFRSVVIANNDIGSVYGTTQRYGIHLNYGNGIGIYGNVIYAEDTGTILNNSTGADNQIRNNVGYITENSGTATLVNGNTSIAVTHGLDVTPVAGDIVVTPIEAWGSMAQFYIDTYTSTQFTIHSNADPGQDVDFAWKGIIL